MSSRKSELLKPTKVLLITIEHECQVKNNVYIRGALVRLCFAYEPFWEQTPNENQLVPMVSYGIQKSRERTFGASTRFPRSRYWCVLHVKTQSQSRADGRPPLLPD